MHEARETYLFDKYYQEELEKEINLEIKIDKYLYKMRLKYLAEEIGIPDTSRLNENEWAPLRNFIFKRDNYTCQYCGEYGKKLECDHIIPISRGGTNDLDNLITTCKNCNRQKRDKLLLEFVLWKLKKESNYAMV